MDVDKMLFCDKMNKSPLFSIDNFKINIKQAEHIKKSIFSPSIVYYPIIIESLNSKVMRSFKHFELFKSILDKKFPDTYIPHLPERSIFDNYTEKILDSRRRMFENFLNYLIEIPVIKASLILHEFLTITDDEKFEKIQDNYQDQKEIEKVSDTKNIEGYVECVFNKDSITKQELIKEYCKKSTSLVDMLLEEYITLRKTLSKASDSLRNISEIQNKLHVLSKSFNDPPTIIKHFNSMSEISLEWSKIYYKQSEFFNLEFREFYSFYSNDIKHFNERSDTYNKLKDNYIKLFANLNNKKEKLYRNTSFNSWEIDPDIVDKLKIDDLRIKSNALKIICKQETDNLFELQSQLGVFCHSGIRNFQQLKNFHATRLRKGFISQCEKNILIISDFIKLEKLLEQKQNELIEIPQSYEGEIKLII